LRFRVDATNIFRLQSILEFKKFAHIYDFPVAVYERINELIIN
jgi:hypothetical protein